MGKGDRRRQDRLIGSTAVMGRPLRYLTIRHGEGGRMGGLVVGRAGCSSAHWPTTPGSLARHSAHSSRPDSRT